MSVSRGIYGGLKTIKDSMKKENGDQWVTHDQERHTCSKKTQFKLNV